MYRWYEAAKICYAYLDTTTESGMKRDTESSLEDDDTKLENSRWFTRAWTLQELIAPPNVAFPRCRVGVPWRQAHSTWPNIQDHQYPTACSSKFLEDKVMQHEPAPILGWAQEDHLSRGQSVLPPWLGWR